MRSAPILVCLSIVVVVGCDDSISPGFVGGTTPTRITDATGATIEELRVNECTEARFEETVTTQGAEDDNRTLYAADGAKADDPGILGVQPSGRTWAPVAPPSTAQTNWFADDTQAPTFLICGLRPGTVVVRVYRGGDQKASLPFIVLPSR